MDNISEKKDFGKRISQIIEHYELTLTDFSAQIGVSRGSIYNLMSSSVWPGLGLIMAIVKAFPEVSMEWLMRGEGAMLKDGVVNYDEVGALRAKVKALEDLYKQAIKES